MKLVKIVDQGHNGPFGHCPLSALGLCSQPFPSPTFCVSHVLFELSNGGHKAQEAKRSSTQDPGERTSSSYYLWARKECTLPVTFIRTDVSSGEHGRKAQSGTQFTSHQYQEEVRASSPTVQVGKSGCAEKYSWGYTKSNVWGWSHS